MKKIMPFLIIGIFVISGIGAGGISHTNTIEQNYDEFDMVIIAPNEFSSHIQPLITHKNTNGVNTILKTTQDIYNEFEGRDNPEKIKFFIKYAIENYNIRYVLIIGGVEGNTKNWYVPVRYVELDDGTGRGSFYISDLYYADIYKNGDEFEDWDSNDDDTIAQWPKDKFDLSPDLCIGRLPCRNTEEVDSVVDKIIDYETNTNGQSWFNKMVAIGGDTFPDYEGYEGEITCDFAAEYMQGFDITKLYYSTGTITSSTEVKNAINSGCGFFFTRAKGGTDRIRLPRSDGTEIIALQNDEIDELSNKGKYPIMILGECQHGEFDKSKAKIRSYLLIFRQIFYKIFKLFQKEQTKPVPTETLNECIAWKLVNKKEGGGIAVISNTHLCFADIGDKNQNGIPDDVERYGGNLAVEVFRLYNVENIDILGEIHFKTIENYVASQAVKTNKIDCKSVQEWILIGDPSLKIGGYP